MKLTLLLLIITTQSFAKVLPDIFYDSHDKKERYCQNPQQQSEANWRSLMGSKINQLTIHRSVPAKNSFITQSYLELFNHTQEMNGVKYMGYVYANASHHLGRLVRYNAWPREHPLREYDRSLVDGKALRILSQSPQFILATKLMKHSLDLYLELSWSLGAASLCGMNYTYEMLSRDHHLQQAYRAESIKDFVRNFVHHEQSYLQENMYSKIDIMIPARGYVLDEMRYISFNGERQTNFSQWCSINFCATSSYHLKNRIQFDVWAILQELQKTNQDPQVMNSRIKNSQIEETADFFMSRSILNLDY